MPYIKDIVGAILVLWPSIVGSDSPAVAVTVVNLVRCHLFASRGGWQQKSGGGKRNLEISALDIYGDHEEK